MSFSSTQYKCFFFFFNHFTTLDKLFFHSGKHGIIQFSVFFFFGFYFKTNPASLPFSFHTQSFQSDSTSFDMPYKMRAGAGSMNGDKGRKGERRSKSDGEVHVG